MREQPEQRADAKTRLGQQGEELFGHRAQHRDDVLMVRLLSQGGDKMVARRELFRVGWRIRGDDCVGEQRANG